MPPKTLQAEINALLGKDTLLTKLQITFLLGLLCLFTAWSSWKEWGEFVGYFIIYVPLAITLIHFSNKVLFENGRPKSHYVVARMGTIVGVLLLIPKWLFYVWFGWQIGLFG